MKFRHNVYRNYANETVDRDISDDFRPAQNLNRRFVYASHESAIYHPSGDASVVLHNILLLAISTVICSLICSI